MHLWGRQREAGQWCRLAPVTSPGGPFDPASVTADGRRGSRPGVSLLSKCHGPSTQAVPSLLPHSHTRTPCSARGRRFLSPLPPRPPPLSRTLPSVATMFMHPADAVLLRRSLRRVVPSVRAPGVCAGGGWGGTARCGGGGGDGAMRGGERTARGWTRWGACAVAGGEWSGGGGGCRFGVGGGQCRLWWGGLSWVTWAPPGGERPLRGRGVTHFADFVLILHGGEGGGGGCD